MFWLGAQDASNVADQIEDSLSLTELRVLLDLSVEQGEVYDQALLDRYHQQALAAPLDSQKVHLIPSYNLLGLKLLNRGQYNEALNVYRQARDLAREWYGTKHDEYIDQLGSIAQVYKQIDLFEEALPLVEEGLNYHRQRVPTDTFTLLQAWKSYANLLAELDQLDESLANWEEILPLSEVVNPDGMGHANTLYSIALLRERAGIFEETTAYFREAADIVGNRLNRKRGFVYSIIAGRLAHSYYKTGQLDSAIIISREAVDIAEEKYPEGNDRLALRWQELAIFLEADGQLAESEQALLESDYHNHLRIDRMFQTLSEMEQRGMLADVQAHGARMQSFALRHPERSAVIGAAYNLQLIYKHLLLRNRRHLQQRLQQHPSPEVVAQFQEWEELYTLVGEQYALPAPRRANNFDSLSTRLAELESMLAFSSRDFRDERTTPSWQAVQTKLQEGEMAIEFAVVPYRSLQGKTDSVVYVAYLLQAGTQAPVLVHLFSAEQFPSLRATRRIYQFAPESERPNLHQLIYQPLAPHLKDVQTIYYAMDGWLHRVNLGAIPVDESSLFADAYQLRQLSSTSLAGSSAEQASEGLSSALLLGGVDFEHFPEDLDQDSALGPATSSVAEVNPVAGSAAAAWRSLGGSDWNHLPWTETEVENIAQQLSAKAVDALLLSGISANETVLKAQLNQTRSPGILHLATHGYFFPEQAEGVDDLSGFQSAKEPLIRSGLILGGANQYWRDGVLEEGRDDGIFTAYEIAQMDLSNTELVVLSACETGLGDIQDGEGVYGLQRAFKLAGARYVLMSLWSVPDRQTQEFMNTFYAHWLEEDMSIPAAYQATLQNLRASYRLPFNPTLWAGFILVE